MSSSGICLQPFIPLRKEPDEKSEMVSQILYGEKFIIQESDDKHGFFFIQLEHDKYTGWIAKNTFHLLSGEDNESLDASQQFITHNPYTWLFSKKTNNAIIIGCGSTIYCKGSQIYDPKEEYNSNEKDICATEANSIRALINYGMKLLNIPYLWGGRSSFGFDCSGLCQNLYKQVGIMLPRDSGPQSETGRVISSLNDALPGDLAFFDNEEGKITHVGILLDREKIMHASGKVKIDMIDHRGIYSYEIKGYSHKLKTIRRILE